MKIGRKLAVIAPALLCAAFGVMPQPGMARTTGDPLKVEGGLVAGAWARNSHVRAYLGLPFAAPPTGDNRWKEPQHVKAWGGVREANTLPPACMQGARAPGSVSIEAYGNRDVPVSEDCLYLNVWTPTDMRAGEKLPVIVWFHGGGFSSGTASKPEFNGEALAQKGAIVVVPNYRLGIFGFFSHPELAEEGTHHASGNYGLLDQAAALQWIGRNIASFGGDPQNVTIMGQSAGSLAVNLHMVSPVSRGLFQRVVAMSGPVIAIGTKEREVAQADGLRFAKMIDSNLAGLRAIPADVLYSLADDMKIRFGPSVDGYFLTENPGAAWSSGKIAKVSYMTGWSSHEFYEGVYDRTLEGFRKIAVDMVGKDRLATVEYLYQVHDDASATAARVALARDPRFGLGTWQSAQAASKAGNPTFLYYWNRPTQTWPGQSLAENSPASLLGAYHGSQVPYIFGTLDLLDRALTPVDRQLSDDWQAAIISFARTGLPQGTGGTAWAAFTPKREQVTMIDDVFHTGDLPNRASLEFFKSVSLGANGQPRSGFVNGR